MVVSLLLKWSCILPHNKVYIFLFLIQARNIRLISEVDDDSDSEGLGELFLNGLSSANPYGARLNIDEQGRLSWPVLFLYPEHAQSDFIAAFHEDSRYLLAQDPSVLAGMLFPCCPSGEGQVDFWLRREENRGLTVWFGIISLSWS